MGGLCPQIGVCTPGVSSALRCPSVAVVTLWCYENSQYVTVKKWRFCRRLMSTYHVSGHLMSDLEAITISSYAVLLIIMRLLHYGTNCVLVLLDKHKQHISSADWTTAFS